MPDAKNRSATQSRRRAPALTIEDREDQLIAMAVDAAEKKLLDGTASNQLLIHYLRLGSTREKLEKEKLRKENELLEAKADSYKSTARIEELYNRAISAMRMYNGEEPEEDDDC